MGAIADTVMAAGGEVDGVIPKPLTERELALETVTQAARRVQHARTQSPHGVVVGRLHCHAGRLRHASRNSSRSIAWAQLGIHRKPIGLLNVGGFFDALTGFVDHAIAQGFIKSKYRGLFVTADRPPALLEALHHHQPPATRRWLSEDET